MELKYTFVVYLQVLPVLPQLILPIKNALHTKNRDIVNATLTIIRGLLETGEKLMRSLEIECFTFFLLGAPFSQDRTSDWHWCPTIVKFYQFWMSYAAPFRTKISATKCLTIREMISPKPSTGPLNWWNDWVDQTHILILSLRCRPTKAVF